jgi:hypothetical protein
VAPRRSRVRLEVYVDRASEPITGSLVYADGRRQAFSGWIELTAALEEARCPDGLEVIAHGEERTGSSDQDEDDPGAS